MWKVIQRLIYLLNDEYCPVAQSGEHRADNSEVVGSKPTWTTKQWPHRLLARSPPFQGGEEGSIPSGATILLGSSSAAERLTLNQDVGGSNPPFPTKTMLTWLEWLRRWIANPKYAGSNPVVNSKYSDVAQWSERRSHTPWVGGSNPPITTTIVL